MRRLNWVNALIDISITGVILLGLSPVLPAQSIKKTWELKSFWGNAYPTHQNRSIALAHPIQLQALDLRLSWIPKVINPFAKAHRNPTWGIGIFSSLHQPSFVGNYQAIYGDVQISLLSPSISRWDWLYGLGTGLGFGFRPYNDQFNKENIYIGSQLNAFIRLETFLRYRFAKTWSFQAGICFYHFSNGGIKLPNKGLNYLPIQFGINKGWVKSIQTNVPQQIHPFPDHSTFEIKAGFGVKNTAFGQIHYNKARISFYYLKRLNLKYSWGAGSDVFLSGPIVYTNRQTITSTISTGIAGIWRWHLTERLRLPLQIGLYVNRNKDHDESAPYYQFLGLEYTFDRHWQAAVQLKAHGGSADFIAWTLGYTIPHHKSF